MSKAVSTGIIISIFILLGGYYFLRSTKRMSESYRYSGYYDNVQGLAEGSPVELRGVKIGKVERIELDGNNRIRVILLLPPGNRLREGSVAILTSGSITGGKSISILPGEDASFLADDAVIPTGIDTSIIDNFSAAVTPAIEEAKLLLQLGDTGLKAFHVLISSGLASQFTRMMIGLDSQTSGYAAFAEGLNNNSMKLTNYIRGANRTTQGLTAKNAQRDSSLNDLAAETGRLTEGESLQESIGQLRASFSELGSRIQSAGRSPAITDKKDVAELSRALDSMRTNIRSLQQDPPGISILGGKKKK